MTGPRVGNRGATDSGLLRLSQDGFEPGAPRPNSARTDDVADPRPQGVSLKGESVDPRTRQKVETEIARRLRGKDGNPRDIADRMARILGNGNVARGMEILNQALQRGRLNIGLAGINGPLGGDRREAALDSLRGAMNGATGGRVDAVLDNANGAWQAKTGEPNQAQLAALREISNLSATLKLPVDVVAHSNGFNALRTFLAENPTARFGQITLINPNIPANRQVTEQAFRNMVRQSDQVHLVTSRADEAVPLSDAGTNGQPVWQQQVNAAAAAGVRQITVLNDARHSVESVGEHLRRPRPNLDFAYDEKLGRTVPRDLEAWRQLGFEWSPTRGLWRNDGSVPKDRAA